MVQLIKGRKIFDWTFLKYGCRYEEGTVLQLKETLWGVWYGDPSLFFHLRLLDVAQLDVRLNLVLALLDPDSLLYLFSS